MLTTIAFAINILIIVLTAAGKKRKAKRGDKDHYDPFIS
jgi:hypothetical protein